MEKFLKKIMIQKKRNISNVRISKQINLYLKPISIKKLNNSSQ